MRTERQETAPVADGAVVMQVDTGVSYSLNAVGAWVWEQLAAPAGVEALCKGVTERFEVSEERARADLDALMVSLERAELVKRAQ